MLQVIWFSQEPSWMTSDTPRQVETVWKGVSKLGQVSTSARIKKIQVRNIDNVVVELAPKNTVEYPSHTP